MNRRNFLATTFTTLTLGSALQASSAKKKPNIVLFYIDDWAWCGTSIAMNENVKNSYMPGVKMPNLERVAKEGTKFSNAYGSPQCSPARACIQTGQSNPRSGYTVFMNSNKKSYYDDDPAFKYYPVVGCISDMFLDKETPILPELLKPLGYVSAHFGKWHLRGNPSDRGYSFSDGETSNSEGNTMSFGLEKGQKPPKRIPKSMNDPKCMFSITDKGMKFIEEQVKKDSPFYLQLSHYAMHEGSECLYETRERWAKDPMIQKIYKEEDIDPETIECKADPAVWFGMAEDLDGRIGAVIDTLKRLGIYDNTYIVCAADNGYRHHELPWFKQPLHGHKWWVWEGGIRVPMIVQGPRIKPGAVFKSNVVNYDILPTFYEWAGGNSSDLQNIDGVSLSKYLEGAIPEKSFQERNLYFHYPHNRTTVPHSAIISGKYKLLHFYQHPNIKMLFNLEKDMGEVENIAKENTEIHARMYKEMMDYFKKVGARIPKPNPDYNPELYLKRGTKAQIEKQKYLVQWNAFEGKRKLEDDEI